MALISSVINDMTSLNKKLELREKELDGALEKLCFVSSNLEKTRNTSKVFSGLKEGGGATHASNAPFNEKYLQKMHQESIYINNLRQENVTCQNCLEEYKNALELIMQKYRSQMNEMIKKQKGNCDQSRQSDLQKFNDEKSCQRIDELSKKIREMASIMVKSLSQEQSDLFIMQNKINQLQEENGELRELLTKDKFLCKK